MRQHDRYAWVHRLRDERHWNLSQTAERSEIEETELRDGAKWFSHFSSQTSKLIIYLSVLPSQKQLSAASHKKPLVRPRPPGKRLLGPAKPPNSIIFVWKPWLIDSTRYAWNVSKGDLLRNSITFRVRKREVMEFRVFSAPLWTLVLAYGPHFLPFFLFFKLWALWESWSSGLLRLLKLSLNKSTSLTAAF